MALVTCQDCGRPVSDEAEACPQCGRRTESSEAIARSVGQVGFVMQVLGGLVAVIGVGTFLLLLLTPSLNTIQTAAIWRGGLLFIFLGMVVCMLGRLAGRAWRR